MKHWRILSPLLAGMMAGGVMGASTQAQEVIALKAQSAKPVAAEYFTGRAWTEGSFRQQAPARAYGAYVTFEPGARTHWHIHPLGQTLVVVSGVGRTQEWGGQVREIRAGDIVVCPPGVKHWHGAGPNSFMRHLAISERQPDSRVQWLEAVDDATYLGQMK